MLPIVIKPEMLNALVIGDGDATDRRLQMLKDAGVKNIHYIKEIPSETDLEGINIAYVADFDDETSKIIADKIRSKGILLNTEDKLTMCDFHVPAIVRRGDLLATVSTNGQSPRMARRFRQILEYIFPKEWSENLSHIGKERQGWKSQGLGFQEVGEKTDEMVEQKEMMKKFCDNCIEASKVKK